MVIQLNSQIKVLHIHTRGIVGGSGTNTLLSMAGLPQDKFIPILACGSEGPLVDEALKKDLAVVILPHLKNKINIFDDLLALFEIIGLIRQEKFTIVHTHNSKAGILGRFAARICGVPIVVHTLHSCVFNYPNLNWFQKRFFLFLEKLAAKITDKLITISEPLKDEFIKAKVASRDKFITIYSGVEIEKFKLHSNIAEKKQELGIPENKFVVGIVGRLDEGKGHEFVLKSVPLVLNEVKDVVFTFVGDGPLRKSLENLATELGIRENVIFTGIRNDVAEVLQVFDIFCLASLYEGMGRVILEAQVAGKPVVATRIGGIPDIVCENKTAFLVKTKDASSLAGALLKLIKDDSLRQAMSDAAEEFVSFKFSSEKMVADIIKVYEELLKNTLEYD
ncbi:MAG: glycosyltransferase family 4 protein [Candidatus Omnitrophota bacterium]|nr:glycosyltransferase family 4 protein [Candidatus Omnitrophota bacterium]